MRAFAVVLLTVGVSGFLIQGAATAVRGAAATPTGSAAADSSRPAGAPGLLYSSDWSGTNEIYAFDPAESGSRKQLTFGRPACAPPVTCGSYFPVPSPDGRRVVFSYYESGKGSAYELATSALLLAHADGTTPRQLISSRGFGPNFYQVAWSPDSSRIAYQASNGVHVVNADGTSDRLVKRGAYKTAGRTSSPAWSPDSRLLAFQTPAGALVVVGNGSMRTVAASSGGFAWSPNGNWIAYDTRVSPYVLALVHPDGTGRRRLIPLAVDEYLGPSLQWSRDGAYLSFYSLADGVGVVDVRTGRIRYLAGDQGSYPLGWAPAWRHTLTVNGKDGIALLDLDTGTSRLLTAERPLAEAATWSPDGRALAYFVRAGNGGLPYNTGYDLRLVTPDGTARTVAAAAGDYGGNIGGLVWTRPPMGVHYRPVVPRTAATVSADQLVAPWPITVLVADGGRVAYVSCGHVFVWTPATVTVEQEDPVASLAPLCSLDNNYVAYQIYSVAIAGDRVAYASATGNIGQDFYLVAEQGGTTSALTSGPATGGSPFICDDVCSGELVGAGGLLAYSSWTGKSGLNGLAILSQEIRRVDGTACPCTRVASQPGPLVPLDIDAGRIVAGGDNATVIYDANGKQLLSVPVSPHAAALSGNDLVILRQGQLLDFDAATGSQIHRWPLPDVTSGRECGSKYCRPIWPDRPTDGPRLVLEDAARGLVAYVLDGNVHLLRLSDGADMVIGPGTLARFMDAGLVYVDSTAIHLVPYDQLPLE